MITRPGKKIADADKTSSRWNNNDVISIVSGTRTARVPIDSIEIVEQQGRRLHIISAIDEYSCHESIETIARLLTERGFYRVMKKLIINFDRVQEINRTEIIFISGARVMMGRNNFLDTKKAFRRYMMKYPPYSMWEPTISLAEREDLIKKLS